MSGFDTAHDIIAQPASAEPGPAEIVMQPPQLTADQVDGLGTMAALWLAKRHWPRLPAAMRSGLRMVLACRPSHPATNTRGFPCS